MTAEELLDQFGFRAIEYGEWLPQERQEVINMAYDSFADLAQALNLRPKDVSLGGELAVAFGTRGTGGRGAALAHFEPGRFVMNMTRMKGREALPTSGSMPSTGRWPWTWAPGSMRPSPKAPHLKALGALATHELARNATPEELAEQSARGAARGKSNAESWLGGIPPEKRGEAVADLSHALETVRERIEKRVDSMVGTVGDRTHTARSWVKAAWLAPTFCPSWRMTCAARWCRSGGASSAGCSPRRCRAILYVCNAYYCVLLCMHVLHYPTWHFAKRKGPGADAQAYAERGLAVPDALGHHELRKPSACEGR